MVQGPAGRGPGRRVPRLEVAGELAAAAGGGERGHPVTPRHWTQRVLLVVPQIDYSVKLYNHGEGPYLGLLLVESGFYYFHI